jgi:hypothetical protein
VAGWAVAIFSPHQHPAERDDYVDDFAACLLGLNVAKATALFEPEGFSRRTEDFTARGAAKVIDHLLNTGRVDWGVAQS